MTAGSRPSSLPRQLLLVLVASLAFLVNTVSPPHLMDDVDATQGTIAKTMLRTGDYVTARLDGVPYLEKAPLKYWITAAFYRVAGVHDWVARCPNAFAVIVLCLLLYRIGSWAGADDLGWYAGLILGTSIGLFLFTRIVIPDVILTLAITVALWSFQRANEEEVPASSRRWALVGFSAIACAVLLKGMIGAVFPVSIWLLYLLVTRQLTSAVAWRRMHLLPGIALFIVLAAPWHVFAILQNPPYFDWTLHADPHFGRKFRGFFWFYFINDQVLRFTNSRWPRDYNTVPRLWFWLYHLLWFFPWSFYVFRLRAHLFGSSSRVARLRLLCLIWIGVVMLFFTASTTQEYYSMPIYPALAILLASAFASDQFRSRWIGVAISLVSGLACLACCLLLIRSWRLPTPGDISDALSSNPDVYTLALGHMTDLTFAAFAYLRLPLALAILAFAMGAAGVWATSSRLRVASILAMLVVFFGAARLALVVFDPYLSSYVLAERLRQLPRGTLIFNGQYYDFSSVPFYTNYEPLLLNGRVNNLEYGSYAPGAPPVFIEDAQFSEIWRSGVKTFAITYDEKSNELVKLVGQDHLYLVARSGGKQLLANWPWSDGK